MFLKKIKKAPDKQGKKVPVNECVDGCIKLFFKLCIEYIKRFLKTNVH